MATSCLSFVFRSFQAALLAADTTGGGGDGDTTGKCVANCPRAVFYPTTTTTVTATVTATEISSSRPLGRANRPDMADAAAHAGDG